MMKSQADMNQLNQQSEQNLHRQKGKAGLGYKEKCESSKQATQRNQRPTCSHCGKLGHTSNKCWSNGNAKFNGKCFNCNQHGHKANECKEKPKFEGKCDKCKQQGHVTPFLPPAKIFNLSIGSPNSHLLDSILFKCL